MKFTKFKHIAYNITTGKVIMATTGNELKRKVRYANWWSKECKSPTGQWFFSHNGKVSDEISEKRGN